jgi:hypothetical protein
MGPRTGLDDVERMLLKQILETRRMKEWAGFSLMISIAALFVTAVNLPQNM